MPLKRAENVVGNGAAQQPNGDDHAEFEFRENPRVNAQIDGYKKQFPKKWAFVKSMSRERLERALIWEKIRGYEQRQRLNRGLFRKIDENPAVKKDCEAFLQHFPEKDRERAKVAFARQFAFSHPRDQKRGVAVAA